MDRSVIEPSLEFDTSKTTTSLQSTARIRSLALSGNLDSQTDLYIGTESGDVILLQLNGKNVKHNGGDIRIKPLDPTVSVSVGKASVDDLLILTEIDRVLVVSNGTLLVIDKGLLRSAQRLAGVRGVVSVSKRLRFGDSASEDPLGDVAAWSDAARQRPRLLQRLGRANGVRGRTTELQRNGEVGSFCCFIAAAVLGKGVVLMELVLVGGVDGAVSVASKEIPGSEGVKTMVWFDDSIIVGTSEGYLLFSVGSGEITPIFSLPELSDPPRMRALCRSKEVLLMVDNVGVIVNGDGHPVGGSLIFKHSPESIVEMCQYVVALEVGSLNLYRKKTGACVQTISFSKGGLDPSIITYDEWGTGEIVAVATPIKVICFRKIAAEEQIKDLLRKKYFRQAICLVEELDLEGEMSREMLSFIHAQLGFLLLFDLQFEEAINHFLLSETMEPSEIFPFIMQDPNRWSHLVPRNRYWGLHPPPMLLEKVVNDGLMAIQRAISFKKAGVDTTVDEDYVLNPPNRSDILELAIKNMIRYLFVCRDKDLAPSVKEGVDTLLMYLYRALNLVDDMEQLASSANSCVVEELESLLDDSGHLRTLAFLYASKGMNSKALEIWHIFARNYSSGLWKDPKVEVHSGLDNSTSIVTCQRAAALEASKLLEESSDQELVLQHLQWVADEDPELAVRVLTSRKRVKQLSPGDVLAKIHPKKVEIHERYLQWLIEDEDSDDTQFHTMYAISLAKSAIQAVEMDCNASKIIDTSRERLQLFLQASDLYDPDEVLYLIKDSELWLEKAILYKKLGQETWVLQILALKLEDSEAAEQYCAEIGRHDAYMQLLDMYLDPQNGKEPMLNAAVRLLHNHGESLDPLQVLEKLSPAMPLQLASDTILRILRARNHHYRQGQIVSKLSSALYLEAQMSRLEERSRHVLINDESICSSCHTRLSTKLLAMYPDDSIACYKENPHQQVVATLNKQSCLNLDGSSPGNKLQNCTHIVDPESEDPWSPERRNTLSSVPLQFCPSLANLGSRPLQYWDYPNLAIAGVQVKKNLSMKKVNLHDKRPTKFLLLGVYHQKRKDGKQKDQPKQEEHAPPQLQTRIYWNPCLNHVTSLYRSRDWLLQILTARTESKKYKVACFDN